MPNHNDGLGARGLSYMKPASNTASGPGNHSDAVKQAAVVGLYSRQESAQVLAEKFEVSRPTLRPQLQSM